MPWSCRAGEGAVGMCSITILKLRKLKMERLRNLPCITQLGNSIAQCRPRLVQSQLCPCNRCLSQGIAEVERPVESSGSILEASC